jgi:hypothetical protein
VVNCLNQDLQDFRIYGIFKCFFAKTSAICYQKSEIIYQKNILAQSTKYAKKAAVRLDSENQFRNDFGVNKPACA